MLSKWSVRCKIVRYFELKLVGNKGEEAGRLGRLLCSALCSAGTIKKNGKWCDRPASVEADEFEAFGAFLATGLDLHGPGNIALSGSPPCCKGGEAVRKGRRKTESVQKKLQVNQKKPSGLS